MNKNAAHGIRTADHKPVGKSGFSNKGAIYKDN